jgi:dipeptidase E
MDGQPADLRREGVDREVTALSRLGLCPEQLDLRDFFSTDDVGVALEGYDLLWLRGGNVFMLRYALARSQADEAIVELLAADSVCYGGYSAGPCVLGGSLVEFAEVDDPSVVTVAYGEPAPERGLGILDWVFVPHVDSPGHPETEACSRVAARYAAAGERLRTFRDGEVLIIDGDAEAVCN